jgi:hypothetical protein
VRANAESYEQNDELHWNLPEFEMCCNFACAKRTPASAQRVYDFVRIASPAATSPTGIIVVTRHRLEEDLVRQRAAFPYQGRDASILTFGLTFGDRIAFRHGIA